MLTDDGVCWVGDAGRMHTHAFYDRAIARGYRIEIRNAAGEHLDGDSPIPDLAIGQFRLLALRRMDS